MATVALASAIGVTGCRLSTTAVMAFGGDVP
jgi:hypothetical protein